jgi:uncharacterized membrane protein YhaH (DUF805 family)
MESHLSTLITYIRNQRENGANDEGIYQALVSSGWQADIVQQAFMALQNSAENTRMYEDVVSNSNEVTVIQKGLHAGRLNRVGFILAHVYIVACFIITISIFIFGQMTGMSKVLNIFGYLLSIFLTIACLILPFFFYARRWHDINQSGWLALLLLIPGAVLPIFFVLLFIPGTRGANNFGSSSNNSLGPLAVYGLRRR